jgi:hypothetical protein
MPRNYDDDDRPRKRPPRRDDDEDRPRPRRRLDDDEDDYDDRPRKKRRSKLRAPQTNVVGVISLVIGILAVLFSFIPCLGLYAFIPGGLGLVLGGIGLVMCYTSEGRYKRGMPIAGLSVNAVAILFGLSWIFVMNHWKKELNKFDKDFQAEMAKAEADRKKEQAAAASEVKAAAGSAIRLTAEQFFQAYVNDSDRADRMYRNKVLELTGVVQAVHIEAGAYGVVLKGGADEGALVECEFAEHAGVRAELSRLTPGQRVTIRGKCLGDGTLEGCVLVE